MVSQYGFIHSTSRSPRPSLANNVFAAELPILICIPDDAIKGQIFYDHCLRKRCPISISAEPNYLGQRMQFLLSFIYLAISPQSQMESHLPLSSPPPVPSPGLPLSSLERGRGREQMLVESRAPFSLSQRHHLKSGWAELRKTTGCSISPGWG